MIPKAAIERAIEGGWQPDEYRERVHFRTGGRNDRGTTRMTAASITPHEIALDPSFWQSLGKVLRWPTSGYAQADVRFANGDGWQNHAHRFYDLILTGGDTETYWKELLTPSQSV